MKRIMLITLVLILGCLCAMSVGESMEPTRGMNYRFLTCGQIWFRTTNFGFLGSGDDFVPQYPSLEYPAGSGTDFLYQAAPWISAKKHRRNATGNLLYWLSDNPSAANNQVITQSDPLWTPDKIAVIDTLTSVGFDGDADLFELLPAYNPLLASNPIVQGLYSQYNSQDIVLNSIQGYPSPRPYNIPDPLGTYCFTIPQSLAFDTPGYITHSAYLYDYCPFGSQGDRDYGSYKPSNTHIPLGLAIHQESYGWSRPNFRKIIIIKYDVLNTSANDTLNDVALSSFFDADVGPVSWGPEKATDDKSGYIQGEGYEFAYSYDADFDGGLSPGYVANKIYIPGLDGHNSAWYWQVGQGPDDHNPLNLAPTKQTANEKYWLATGRNPNLDSYMNLRPTGINEYEQPVANDTRFLYSLYGNQPTPTNPNPAGRLNIAPGESLSYYAIVFCGDTIAELKELSVLATEFIDNGLQFSNPEDFTCIPYLMPISIQTPNAFVLNWLSESNPDHFQVMYKPYNAPASQWQIIDKPGNYRSHSISNLSPTLWYEMKVASIYNPGVNEVYLESDTQLVNYQFFSSNEDPLALPGMQLSNYPNPFKPSTTVTFDLKEAGDASLNVYNIKGQLLRSLLAKPLPSGAHSVVWDARDDNGNLCASGVYYMRLTCGSNTQVRKMLILK